MEIRKTTRGPLPRIPFEKIAREILGTRYALSLVICGDKLSQHMNKKYRKKTYVPNVLSFPLTRTEGEIFLNPRVAAREALPAGRQGAELSKSQKESLIKERIILLFAHGCLHLKGMKHGPRMESIEAALARKYTRA